MKKVYTLDTLASMPMQCKIVPADHVPIEYIECEACDSAEASPQLISVSGWKCFCCNELDVLGLDMDPP